MVRTVWKSSPDTCSSFCRARSLYGQHLSAPRRSSCLLAPTPSVMGSERFPDTGCTYPVGIRTASVSNLRSQSCVTACISLQPPCNRSGNSRVNSEVFGVKCFTLRKRQALFCSRLCWPPQGSYSLATKEDCCYLQVPFPTPISC